MQEWDISQRCKTGKHINKGKGFSVKDGYRHKGGTYGFHWVRFQAQTPGCGLCSCFCFPSQLGKMVYLINVINSRACGGKSSRTCLRLYTKSSPFQMTILNTRNLKVGESGRSPGLRPQSRVHPAHLSERGATSARASTQEAITAAITAVRGQPAGAPCPGLRPRHRATGFVFS